MIPIEWPRWVQMWALALAVYAGCKWLTWRAAAPIEAPAWKRSAYLLAWPGMDPRTFLGETAGPAMSTCARADWLRATGNVALGTVLLFGLARWVRPPYLYATGWVGMIGLVLILHFGAFHLLSCWWRSHGLDARPLMIRPLMSHSLGEFWGRRWNTAFRDLTHQFLFRRCAESFGPRWGAFVAFLFSGAIHDLVISVPAGGGYGRPTAFFAIQGAAAVFERSRLGRAMGLGFGWRGRSFTMAILALPAPWLFHPPFVAGIIVPFMRAVGAI